LTLKDTGFPLPFQVSFICLLILQIRSRLHAALMVVAGVLSLFFKEFLPGNWTIVVTALVTSSVGVLVQRKKPQKRQRAESMIKRLTGKA